MDFTTGERHFGTASDENTPRNTPKHAVSAPGVCRLSSRPASPDVCRLTSRSASSVVRRLTSVVPPDVCRLSSVV